MFSGRYLALEVHHLLPAAAAATAADSTLHRFMMMTRCSSIILLLVVHVCRPLEASTDAWRCVLQADSAQTRNSSEDDIANVNFFTTTIVHAPQNKTESCINSATDRRGYLLEHTFTKFSEITQCNGHYTVQGHSRSPILVPIESSYTTSY